MTVDPKSAFLYLKNDTLFLKKGGNNFFDKAV